MLKRLILLVLAIVSWPIVFVVTVIKRGQSSDLNGKNILLINNAKIGDLVCTSPMFRAIKRAYPQSRITLITINRAVGILKNNPHLDEIIVIDGQESVWDIFWRLRVSNFSAAVVVVPGTVNYLLPFFLAIPIRSGTSAPEHGWYFRLLSLVTTTKCYRFFPNRLSVKHYLELLRPLGIDDQDLRKEVYYTKEARAKAEELLGDFVGRQGTKLVGISLSAGNKMKEWPVEKFIIVAKAVYQERGFFPVFVGSSADQSLLDRAKGLLHPNIPPVFISSLSLEELPALLSLFDYFISVDSGPLYIANALDVPVVDIVGPCNIYDQVPIYEKCEAVYVPNLPGWPYTSVLKTVTCLSSGQRRCLDDLTPEMVLIAFDRLVKKYGRG